MYRKVKNMNTDEDAVEYKIDEAFQDGIYFWGRTKYVYCLKQTDRWGVNYHRSTNMRDNTDSKDWNVHPSVINFLPGGVAQTKGRAFGYWEKLKSFENESDTAVDWERTINKTVGFKKSTVSSIEHNWSVSAEAQHSGGGLVKAIVKYQFSLKAQYGGKSVDTKQQDWSDVTEKSETIKMHIKPKSEVSVWQYQMGLGDEKSLFCADLSITQGSNPPEVAPK